jgi:hypothetical protein
VSPIFVRPVREQLEHDRLIRFLQAKHKRKFEVAINMGDERVAPVKAGTVTVFPDLVLTDDRHKVGAVIEVESGESVNNLEAMAQWVHFGRARVPFHLYVPVHVYDVARRLCEANQVDVAELWTYRQAIDGFDLVRMFHDASASPSRGAARAGSASKSAKAAKKKAPAKPAKKPARAGSAKKAARASTKGKQSKKSGRKR